MILHRRRLFVNFSSLALALFHLMAQNDGFFVKTSAFVFHGTEFTNRQLTTTTTTTTTTALFGTADESKLTDWVVENLEVDAKITSESATRAGENDSLPDGGLRIGRFRILPSGAAASGDAAAAGDVRWGGEEDDPVIPIRLFLGRNGWGTGVHPTTRLCLEWLARPDVMLGGERVLDYGCGSGILSIGALSLGASSAVGVDVEAEALVTAERNLDLNGHGDRFEGLHTREIIPYCLCRPAGVDVCVANILVGQLVRPSMVSAIVTNLAPRAWLCLSGIRPAEVDSLKRAYGEYIDWADDHCADLAASDTPGSIDNYGFDVGTWSRLVGRLKVDSGMDIETMSELAVS